MRNEPAAISSAYAQVPRYQRARHRRFVVANDRGLRLRLRAAQVAHEVLGCGVRIEADLVEVAPSDRPLSGQVQNGSLGPPGSEKRARARDVVRKVEERILVEA